MGIPAARQLPAKVAARKRREKARAKSCLPERRCPVDHDSLDNLVDGSSAHPEDEVVKNERFQQGKEQMLANGWCCHQVDHLFKVYSLEVFSYLATLTRSPYRFTDHKRCLEHTACVAYNTDLGAYRTSHVTQDCNCQMVFTPYDQLTKIVRDGSIPLISFEDDPSTGSVQNLQVHARSRKSSYIAISHVW